MKWADHTWGEMRVIKTLVERS